MASTKTKTTQAPAESAEVPEAADPQEDEEDTEEDARPPSGMIEPEEVAEAVSAGLANDDFLILPHPEVARYELNRAGDRGRWLAGMRRLQATLPGS